MQKLPPIEKIYEAYSALADNRIKIGEGFADVLSSDSAKSYKVVWKDNTYSSTDNATYWQGYAGYPVIGVLILQSKLTVDTTIFEHFSDVNWNSLNKKHNRDYRAALLEVFSEKKLLPEQIDTIEQKTQQVFEQLKTLDIKIVRTLK
ncbi:hypothetical protein IMSAGC011_03061 [Lachnospiraceae bacterium]|nr:hypothetical protein IMSAGC011_03061 [Lachnospiraceae bacterium]